MNKRVYLPLYTIADTPFHIQGDEIMFLMSLMRCMFNQPRLANVQISDILNPLAKNELLLKIKKVKSFSFS